MIDPLADSRAADLLAASPDDVRALAQTFRTAADEAGATSVGLRAAGQDRRWKGEAAEAFRSSIGRLPVELGHVRAGYAAVAAALFAYDSALAPLKDSFVSLTNRLTALHPALDTARAEAETASQALVTLLRQHHPDRRAVEQAETRAARADAAFHRLDGEARSLVTRAMTVLDEFATVRGMCTGVVRDAQATAIRDPHPEATARLAPPPLVSLGDR